MDRGSRTQPGDSPQARGRSPPRGTRRRRGGRSHRVDRSGAESGSDQSRRPVRGRRSRAGSRPRHPVVSRPSALRVCRALLERSLASEPRAPSRCCPSRSPGDWNPAGRLHRTHAVDAVGPTAVRPGPLAPEFPGYVRAGGAGPVARPGTGVRRRPALDRFAEEPCGSGALGAGSPQTPLPPEARRWRHRKFHVGRDELLPAVPRCC